MDQIRDAHEFAAVRCIYSRDQLILLNGDGVVSIRFRYSGYDGDETFADQSARTS